MIIYYSGSGVGRPEYALPAGGDNLMMTYHDSHGKKKPNKRFNQLQKARKRYGKRKKEKRKKGKGSCGF